MQVRSDLASSDILLINEPEPHLLTITLNRPEVANAINTRLGGELLAAFQALTRAPEPYRCVILTGAGERHFCAGGDLRERKAMTNEEWFIQHRLFEQMTLALLDCPVPVIAALNGSAIGGGCELALCCDFIYAVSGTKLALTETSLGIMPGCGGTQNLPRAVGNRRAKELIFSAKPFSSEEAQEWGLVNQLCEPGTVLQEALGIARRICGNGPIAVRQAKRSIDYGSRVDLRTSLFLEVDIYNRMVPTEDRREGVLAYNEKRKPQFKGE